LQADSLQRVLMAYYGFTQVHCRLHKAMMADTYSIWADNARYSLRIYRNNQRTHGQIAAEVRLLRYLDEMGVPVTVPVPKRGTDDCIFQLDAPEGERFVVLFRYIEGRLLAHDLSQETAYAYGGSLAHMHQTLDKLTLPFDRPAIDTDVLLREPIRALKSTGLLAHRARDLGYLHRITSVLRTRLIALESTRPQYGIIHGDVDTSNAVIMQDGRVGLLDFDYVGDGWRAYDLAAFHSDAIFRGAGEDVSYAFFEGYRSYRPITDLEYTMLPVLRAARAVWSLGLYALNVNEWGSSRLQDGYIDRLLDDIRTAMVELQLDDR